MSNVEQAYQSQMKNIQSKTGKKLDELGAIVKNSGLRKHSELREMLMSELGLGYGDANSLVHYLLDSDGERAAKVSGIGDEELLNGIYTAAKAGLRPIHDQLMAEIARFGDFEVAPKKGYVSLRRKKQFAMIGPATNSQVEVGLNVKGLDDAERLKVVPAGAMCNYKVRLADPTEVDGELVGWLKQAYDSAG